MLFLPNNIQGGLLLEVCISSRKCCCIAPRHQAFRLLQNTPPPIPLLSILSNVVLAHANDILPDLLLLLPHLFENDQAKDDSHDCSVFMRHKFTHSPPPWGAVGAYVVNGLLPRLLPAIILTSACPQKSQLPPSLSPALAFCSHLSHPQRPLYSSLYDPTSSSSVQVEPRRHPRYL